MADPLPDLAVLGPVTTRFAPSPSGALHLGHAYAAIVAHELARRSGGRFLVRIEDIDRGRCRREYEAALFEDLRWLGLRWQEPVRRQSEHAAEHRAALERLEALGLLYPCFCTRKEIRAEIERSPAAPHGPEGALYPGTCRELGESARAERLAAGQPCALRLNARAARASVNGPLRFTEHGRGPAGECGELDARPEELGDVVLARKDIGTSYHLAVTVDDAAQNVSVVTRGQDLFHATHVHVLLQAVLGLPTPHYVHHDLVRDESGERLATRDRALALASLRSEGFSPAALREKIGLAGFF